MTIDHVPKDIMQAFAVLGLAWLDRLPTVGDAIHKAVHPSLALGEDGVWRPVDAEVSACYPDGLSLTEALGLTLVVRWVEACEGTWSPVRYHNASYWGWYYKIHLLSIDAGETVRVGTAWLTIRRAMRPPVPWGPWGPRDPVAEELKRVVRAASARLSPARVETLRPEVIVSDLGRNWRG